jgi:hypothetical protein
VWWYALLLCVALGISGCRSLGSDSATRDPVSAPVAPSAGEVGTHDASIPGIAAGSADRSAELQQYEQLAAERDAERACEHPRAVYDGSIAVNSTDYIHSVARGDDFVDVPIEGLDRIISASAKVRFSLDYPFEKPFNGVVTGQITLRRTIDAIRAGFRHMYEGSTEREIPGMSNKDVSGPYGRAFHAIDDLVIEHIDLCADDSLVIDIGS